jgi:hypothetical protein
MRYASIAIAIGLATTLPAQITSKLVTAAQNSATVKTSVITGQSIPPNVDVTGGANLSGSSSMRCNLSTKRGKTSLLILGGGGGSCSFYSTTDVDSAWICSSGLSVSTVAYGDVYFDLTSGSGVVDRTLVVSVTFAKTKGFCVTSAGVDVGDDGNWEFLEDLILLPKPNAGNESYSISVPIRIGPTPTRVRLVSSLDGNSLFGTAHSLRVAASVVPTGGVVTKRGAACQSGVELEVSHVEHKPPSGPTTQTVNLRPKSLPASAVACVYAFGGQEWQIPLAPTNCLLRNNATVLIFVPPSAPKLVLDFPAGTTPLTFYGQFAFATKAAGGYDLLHTSDSFLAVLK